MGMHLLSIIFYKVHLLHFPQTGLYSQLLLIETMCHHPFSFAHKKSWNAPLPRPTDSSQKRKNIRSFSRALSASHNDNISGLNLNLTLWSCSEGLHRIPNGYRGLFSCTAFLQSYLQDNVLCISGPIILKFTSVCFYADCAFLLDLHCSLCVLCFCDVALGFVLALASVAFIY